MSRLDAVVSADLPQGWFHHQTKVLALLETHRPLVSVELGSWRGASAIAMARKLKIWGGTLTCIDTWTGNVNGSYGGTRAGSPAMLAECAENLVAAGVSHYVRLIVARTTDAARAWHGPIDFLYVDADHHYQSVLQDLNTWWGHLKVGGLIAGDDYLNPMYPGVCQAWDEFEKHSGTSFERFATPRTDPPGMQLIYGVKR
jgi:predicted O-methyltransferase YrrM